MAVQEDEVRFDIRGDIFQINGTRVWDPANPQMGTLTFRVDNGAGKWIDLWVESTWPQTSRIWQTGHINNGESAEHQEQLTFHVNKGVRIKRWAPGVFGIPGDGGGEVLFAVPESGDVTISMSVTG